MVALAEASAFVAVAALATGLADVVPLSVLTVYSVCTGNEQQLMTCVSLLTTALMGICIAYDAFGQVTVSGEKGSRAVTTDEIRKYARGGSATDQFKQYIKDGEIKGNNIISQVDDSTQIIFRDDTGEFAHAIRSHGYINPVNHYNIEIQTKSTLGKWKSVWSFHIIMDDEKNIIDTFGKGGK